MSSEFDFSLENFLHEDINTELGGGDSYTFDTHFSDFRMLDTATGNFDTLDCEALGQANPAFNAANALRPPQLARLDFDVAPNQLLIADASGFDLDAPIEIGESGGSEKPQEESPRSSLNTWRCPWPGCSMILLSSTADESEKHIDRHWIETRAQWTGASNCPWPKCSSKAIFKSLGSLRTHLVNIHVTPLVCTQPQCSYTQPFGRQFDLDRHILTAHGDARNCKCPIESCPASATGFARKDKLVKHLKEEHENLKCPYNQCFATVPKSQEEAHVQQAHGVYECGIGGCENGRASRFLIAQLKQHLRKAHGLHYDAARDIVRYLDVIHQKTVNLNACSRFRKWHNCATCCSQ